MMLDFFEWFAESAVLVLIVLVARKAFAGRIKYSVMYALWLAVLVRLIIPFNFVPVPVSMVNLFQDKVEYNNPGRDVSVEKAEKGVYDIRPGVGPVNVSSSGIRHGVSVKYVVIITVSVCMLLWMILSNVHMLGRIKRNRKFCGCYRNINIYSVSFINSPCLYGFIKPAIYIPASVVNRNTDNNDGTDIGLIIKHEYVHYMHKDHIWSVCRIVLVSMLWFNPFVWIAAYYSKKDAELSCDETVVEKLGFEERISYGEMIIRLASGSIWGEFRYLMVPMSRKGREMKKRIHAITTKRVYSGYALGLLVFTILAAVGFTCGTGKINIQSETSVDMQHNDTANDYAAFDAGKNEVVIDNMVGIDSMVTDDTVIPHATDNTENDNGNQVLEYETAEAQITDNTYEDAFTEYVHIFTDSVNSGNIKGLGTVVKQDSSMYEQQCKMALNYYGRGISEEVIEISIVSANKINSGKVQIDSSEKIEVTYADASSKLVEQQYRYTCENIEGKWVLTGMDDC